MAGFEVRRRKKSAARRAQLLEIAAKIFAEQGYVETGIETILKEAGLTGPALYRHFASKQEILDTICINSMQQGLKHALDVQSEPGLNAEEKLKKLLKIRLDYLCGPMGHSAILATTQRAHLSDVAYDRVLVMQREFRANCSALLKQIRPKLRDSEIEVIFFAAQQMAVYSIWRSKNRQFLPEPEHRALLEKMMWSTLLA